MPRFLKLIILTCILASTSPMHAGDEHPFVIIIYAHNAGDTVIRNLFTVIAQEYTNYRVIYIDDASDDATAEFAKNYVYEHNQEHRFTFVHIPEHRGELAALYAAVHSCADNEIVLPMRATDWFVNNNALSTINHSYASGNVWFTYSMQPPYQTTNPYRRRPMPEAIVNLACYREYDWEYERPYTFYAGLFKKIHLEDLLHDGTFFQQAIDTAYVFPLLEMVEKKFATLPDIIYTTDRPVPMPLNNTSAYILRSQKRYTRVEHPSITYDDPSVTLMLFADSITRATTFLTSAYQNLSSLTHTFVFYSGQCDAAYEQCKKRFSQARFVPYVSKNNLADFVSRAIEKTTTPGILFAHDACLITAPCDLNLALNELNRTCAYGFYLTRYLANNCPPSVPLAPTIRAWQFYTGSAAWRVPNTFDLVLYRTTDCVHAFNELRAHSWQELATLWAGAKMDLSHIGLFFEQSKAQLCN